MRQEITKQLIEILAAIVILVIVSSIIYVAAAALLMDTIQSKNSPNKPTKAFELYTGQHDGHLWILNRTSDYFLHHPDCTCGKAEKNE